MRQDSKDGVVLIAIAAVLLGGGCQDECDAYCSTLVRCMPPILEELFDDAGMVDATCGWESEDHSRLAVEACVVECSEARADVSDGQWEDAAACLSCQADELGGACSWESLMSLRTACPVCEHADEFFDEFQWEPDDDSLECDFELPERCGQHGDCEVGELCVQDKCVSAYTQRFRVEARSATISVTNPATGNSWDGNGGAPDCYVVFYAGGREAGVTSYVSDSYRPVWNQGVELGLTQTTDVDLKVFDWDDDVGDTDLVLWGTITGEDLVEEVRVGDGLLYWSSSDGGTTLTGFVRLVD